MKLKAHFLAAIVVIASLTGALNAIAQCSVQTKAVNTVGGSILPCGTGGSITLRLTGAELDVFYVLYKNNAEDTSFPHKHNNNGGNIDWVVTATGSYGVKAYMDGCSDRYWMSGGANVTRTTPTTISIGSNDADNVVCISTGYTLTASGGSGYTWHSSVTMDYPINQSTIHPELTGDYWVTGTNNCGASQTSNVIHATVKPNVNVPSVPALGSGYTQMTCKGAHANTDYNSTALNAEGYSWSITGGHSVSSSGMVTWNANFTGTATLTVTATGCGPAQQNSLSIPVGSVKVASLASWGGTNVPLCTDATITMELTGSPYLEVDVKYEIMRGTTVERWFYGQDANDQPRISVTFPASTVATYTARATGNGCTNIPMTGSVVITKKNPGTLSIAASTNVNRLCFGDPLNLTVSGGSNYSWMMQAPAGSGEQDVHVNTPNAPASKYYPLEDGSYYVKGKESSCNTDVQTDPYYVNFYPYPPAVTTPGGAVTICSTCSLPISVEQGHLYQWKKDGSALTGATNYSYSANQAGAYTVDVTEHFCTSTSEPLQVSINQVPSVDAGPDVTLYTPTQAMSRAGQCFDTDGTLTTIQWTKVSGPYALLANANTTNVTMSSLVVGTYVFRLTVTDNLGDVAYDDFTLTVESRNDNYNFVKEHVLMTGGKVTTPQVMSATFLEKTLSSSYFDGLGRPWQVVQWKASPGQHDVVQPVTYDQFGRENTKYLPYTDGSNGIFKPNFIRKENDDYDNSGVSPQFKFYQETDNVAEDLQPYAVTTFENSPANRVIEQGSAGALYQPGTNHTVTKSYLLNDTEEVKKFTYDANTGKISVSVGYYDKNSLTSTKTSEDGSEVLEFTDKEGRMICKKVKAADGVYASTYYVYDDFGNLVVVIPPEGIEHLRTGN